MAEPQNGGNPPQHLNLDEFGSSAADDPEMNDRYSREAKAWDQGMAKLRQEAWDRSVGKILLTGSNGYISEQFARIDPRPALSDDDCERLITSCEHENSVAYPVKESTIDTLSEAFQDAFNSTFSAPVDSLQNAAQFLGIDSKTGRISDALQLTLRPDQIQNVAFMIKHGEGILRGCFNANPSGTGKTIEGLTAIHLLAKRNFTPGNSRYKHPLILCSPAAMKSLQRDYNRYFRPGKLLYLHVFNGRGSGSAQKIKDELEALDSTDFRTSNHIFLFTYTTFASRFLKAKDKELFLHQKHLANPRSKLAEEQVEFYPSFGNGRTPAKRSLSSLCIHWHSG